MSEDTLWGELNLFTDGFVEDINLDLDDAQFWFEEHPDHPGFMRICINLTGANWTAIKDHPLVKARQKK